MLDLDLKSRKFIKLQYRLTCPENQTSFSSFCKCLTYAGPKNQVRRSSRIRQNSLPKTTSTNPIDLIDSEDENNMTRVKKPARRPADNYYVCI